jgi:hypothetical protein
MTAAAMRMVIVLVWIIAFGFASLADAQEAAPPIPFVVVDLHGNSSKFPDHFQLAESRDLEQAELPGLGFGGQLGLHLYPVKLRAVTFGLGGQLMLLHASRAPQIVSEQTTLRAVSERLTSIAPQLSFNFGTGAGWSYLSGGIGTSKWSVVPKGGPTLPPDEEALKTINYGGGARWFAKAHLAFSFDVRFYALNPSSPTGGLPGSPRTTLMVVGAGISIK